MLALLLISIGVSIARPGLASWAVVLWACLLAASIATPGSMVGMPREATQSLRIAITAPALGAALLVGMTMSAVAADLHLFVQMLGSLIVAFGRVIRHPTTFRFTSTIHQLERVGWRAVPIILLITVLIGAILAQQGIFHFRKFGADIYVIDMVGVLFAPGSTLTRVVYVLVGLAALYSVVTMAKMAGSKRS